MKDATMKRSIVSGLLSTMENATQLNKALERCQQEIRHWVDRWAMELAMAQGLARLHPDEAARWTPAIDREAARVREALTRGSRDAVQRSVLAAEASLAVSSVQAPPVHPVTPKRNAPSAPRQWSVKARGIGRCAVETISAGRRAEQAVRFDLRYRCTAFGGQGSDTSDRVSLLCGGGHPGVYRSIYLIATCQ